MDRVPVIDMQPWNQGGTDERADFARRVDAACRRWGFFQIVGHGIPAALIARFHTQMRRFFELPKAAKHAVARTADNPWGYYDRELTKNVRDWKEIFDFAHPSDPELPHGQSYERRDSHHRKDAGTNRWPAGLPEFQATLLAYASACEALAFGLLEAMCTGLRLAPTRLEAAFRPRSTSFLRLNYYPLCDNSSQGDAPSVSTEGVLGVNRHSDAGAITILSQSDVAALQVFQAGTWTLVEPIPDALVINVGDMLQVFTNDRYRAPLHRVLANEKMERFSAPYFFNPAYETDCAPLPELIDDAHPPSYTTVNWGEFRRKRADGDYADVGDEIQIAHYRT